MNYFKKYWKPLLLATFIVVMAYYVLRSFFGLFDGASDGIKATSITAFVSVLVFTMGRYLEQRREAKQTINVEKIEVYKKFFDFYFDAMSYEKLHDKPIPQDKVLREMLSFQKEIIFWGTDSVIKAYLDFKDALVGFSESAAKDNAEELPQKLATMIGAVSVVLIAMRRDVGYSFTSLDSKDLARLQLSQDVETMKIFDHL